MLKKLRRLLPVNWFKKTPIIHVLRLEGPIVAEKGFRPTLNSKGLEPLLRKAFRKGVAGVALAINCPGGSPVQSAIIGNRIRELSVEHKIPVYAFCEDVAASGGYWLACAADEIYADSNSIVGSIGVISMGFGFPKALQKYGVERRVHTSGESKSINDPFKPEKAEDVAKLKVILGEMHENFKAWVRMRRGEKLDKKSKELFSGAYWTGDTAKKLGLIDDTGHLQTVLRRKFGERVEFVNIEGKHGWGARFGLGAKMDMDLKHLPDATIDALEARNYWQKFGL